MELENKRKMEENKRKREDSDGKRRRAQEDGGGVKAATPAAPVDEEVEEFFAILKRIHVAVKYFRERNGGRRDLTATVWSPSFEREDFEGVEEYPESSGLNKKAGLDLNSDPNLGVSGPFG